MSKHIATLWTNCSLPFKVCIKTEYWVGGLEPAWMILISPIVSLVPELMVNSPPITTSPVSQFAFEFAEALGLGPVAPSSPNIEYRSV